MDLGGAFTGTPNAVGLIAAVALIAGMVYMLFFRKYKEATVLTEKLKTK